MLRAFSKLGESGDPRMSAVPLAGKKISKTFCGRRLLLPPLEVPRIENGRREP